MTGSSGQVGLANANFNMNMDVGSMFTGDGVTRQRRQARKAYEYALRYQPGITAANQAAQIQGMRDAGLHPAFALGTGGGSSPAFNMPGQSPSGSFADAGAAISFGQKDPYVKGNLEKQKLTNEILALERDALKNNTPSNDKAQVMADHLLAHGRQARGKTSPRNIGPVQRGTVEIEPNKIIASEDGGSTAAGVMPAWYTHQFSKDFVIRAPAQETSEIFESMAMWPLIIADKENQKQFAKLFGKKWMELPQSKLIALLEAEALRRGRRITDRAAKNSQRAAARLFPKRDSRRRKYP